MNTLAHDQDQGPHVVPIRVYLTVFAILMVLLVATLVAARIDLGRLNIVLALAIAGAKAALVMLFFMHVRYGSRMTWLFAAAGFVWLVILISLTMSDYLSRGWMPFSRGWLTGLGGV